MGRPGLPCPELSTYPTVELGVRAGQLQTVSEPGHVD